MSDHPLQLSMPGTTSAQRPSCLLSVVIPVLNEVESIDLLIDAVQSALREIDHETIIVDDYSTDGTREKVRARTGSNLMLVELRKNYGQSTAMAAGIDQASGEYIAFLDGDLQNDPLDIPMMLDKIRREDWDIVAGNRKDRKDKMLVRKIPSLIANRLIRRITKVTLQDFGCTLKVMRAEEARALQLHGEMHRFIPAVASLNGARMTEVDVRHHPRRFGTSKYNLSRTFRVISDLMLIYFMRRYSQKPMHIFGTGGFLAFSAGVLVNLYLFALKLMGQDIWGKPLLILGMILLLGGIQLITIGILADIGLRTYHRVAEGERYRLRRVTGGRRVESH
jgi:glycosyltransferase involved in cell wall biosynthesis